MVFKRVSARLKKYNISGVLLLLQISKEKVLHLLKQPSMWGAWVPWPSHPLASPLAIFCLFVDANEPLHQQTALLLKVIRFRYSKH